MSADRLPAKSWWKKWPILVVTCLSILPACQETQSPNRQRRQAASSQPDQDHIAKALEYLEQIDQFDERSAHAQAAYQLNRWLDAQKSGASWEPDPMANRLPRSVRERGVLDTLGRNRFDIADVKFVQECVWMRQLGSWVVRQPLDPLVTKWVDEHRGDIGDLPAEQLGVAYRLFDWTVRNIQLDELLASPDEATVAPAVGTDGNASTAAIEPAAIRGIPGPGYQFEPSQTLLYGHGDAWQRMRVFTLLARQQNLDVVTLAFPGRTIPPRPRPWVSAVLLGEQLYLFDLRLGLPIFRSQAEGIATLKDVIEDPKILAHMEIDERHTYRVSPEDLGEVVALVDVVEQSLSRRMDIAEKQLIGEHRTVLSVPVTPLSNRLKACKGISDVYLWSVPFEAKWYAAAFEKRVQNDQQAALQHFVKYSMFLNRSPLARGRITYLRGQIENQEDEPGAKTLLSQSRVSDFSLNEFEANEQLQQQLGLQRVTSNEQQWQAQLAMFKEVLIETKQHASFWLGMCQLESGRADASIEWLKTRSLETWPTGLWAPLARYNLARAYEQQQNFAEAQRLLLADKSLQEHGNYLRAKVLEKQLSGTPQPTKTDGKE